ncbi:hypothetical protein ACH6EH_07125 [Paenibacillus sp. JSM ZJ436]|uniref:hypothetical protein n=1 Tax=Paenibacillus sp. JSM ZJ436 TaxID=3376190 RepID=UPI003795326D
MNQEEFNEQYKQPVDLDEVHAALQRFINGKGRLCVPARPDDDDMLICRLMYEVKKYRKASNKVSAAIPFSEMSERAQIETIAAMKDE